MPVRKSKQVETQTLLFNSFFINILPYSYCVVKNLAISINLFNFMSF